MDSGYVPRINSTRILDLAESEKSAESFMTESKKRTESDFAESEKSAESD